MREAIVEAVSHIDVGTVEGLIDVLVDSGDTAESSAPSGRSASCRPLAAAGALDRLSQDPEPAVRAAAIEALGRVGGEVGAGRGRRRAA